MGRLIAWAIVLFLVVSSLISLVDGEAHGFVSRYSVQRDITFQNNPFEFISMMVFKLGIGLWIIKKLLSKDDE